MLMVFVEKLMRRVSLTFFSRNFKGLNELLKAWGIFGTKLKDGVFSIILGYLFCKLMMLIEIF